MNETAFAPSERQLAMVINLDKCIGCQACTVACRTHWKAGREGTEGLYDIWVETKPGEGFPKGWMDMGGKVPDWVEDYGGSWSFNFTEVLNSPRGATHLHPVAEETGEPVSWGPAWEEDQGGGDWPNGYFFYMPRLCNHCTDAPCVQACAEQCAMQDKPAAMSKRASDGIVSIDPERCLDCGQCVVSCPYKVPMRNLASHSYEQCDMCSSRVDRGFAPVCAKSCPGRAMYVGYLDDPESLVHKLVNEYEVAVPLRPDFGTGPNVYYVPPFSRPLRVGEGNRPLDETDIPVELLREYFGPEIDRVLATLKEHRQMAFDGEESDLMEALIIYQWADAFAPFDVSAPEEPIENGVQR